MREATPRATPRIDIPPIRDIIPSFLLERKYFKLRNHVHTI